MGEKSNVLAISYYKWMNEENFESKLYKLIFLFSLHILSFLASQNGLKAQILVLHVHGIGLKSTFTTSWDGFNAQINIFYEVGSLMFHFHH